LAHAATEVSIMAVTLPMPAILMIAETIVLICGMLIMALLIQEAVDGLLRWWFRRRRASR
jgi:hypothetical protein